MNAWSVLAIAIVVEVIATTALKYSAGFTRPLPTVVTLAGYALAFYCLSVAIRTIPLGVAYAVWSGVGIILISVAAWLFLDQRLDLPAITGIALIIAGVAIINLFSESGESQLIQ